MADEDKLEQPIIIKKIKKGGGHHGGAWKVAYADFVTAMMAFFLLLWLLNVSTDEQRQAISNYFDPSHPQVSSRESGAGGVLGGLSMATEGAMTTTVQPIASPQTTGTAGNIPKSQRDSNLKGGAQNEGVSDELEEAKNKLRAQEEERFKKTAQALKNAIARDAELNELKDNILIDQTPEGLRIQVIDKDGNPMFATGSAQMFDKTEKLFRSVAAIIKEQPNELSIRGHTDSVPYGPGATYTNWELSADRANSSRRVLLDAGFEASRIHDVVGKADTEPLIPDDPAAASNRRVSIILLKEELTNPDFEKKAAALIPEPERTQLQEPEATDASDEGADEESKNSGVPGLPKLGTFKRTPGKVEFP